MSWPKGRPSPFARLVDGVPSDQHYLYNVWLNMKRRCANLNDPNYGGRGITVCSRWLDFPTFVSDMGRRPSPKHSLERKNNNGNYEPSNCCWATAIEQQNNTSRNRLLVFNNETKTVAEWSRVTGIEYETIRMRLRRNKTIAEALTKGSKLNVTDSGATS